jgi:hypothetical protein
MSSSARDRLRLFSARMSWIAFTLAFVLPPIVLVATIKALNGSDAGTLNGIGIDAAGMPFWAKAAIVGINGAVVLVLSTALWRLQETFRHLGAAEPMLRAAAASLAAAGRWFLAAALGGFLAATVTTLLATQHLPDGQRIFSIGFGAQEMFGILIAGSLIALAECLGLAATIEAENRAFV